MKSNSKGYKIFCFIGPSGTGKDTIAQAIPLPQVVSYRTRAIRPGEIDGVHGHFIDKDTFLEMDKYHQWIAKTLYAGNYYGITQGELLELEHSPMTYVIDWDGVVTLKEGIDQIEGYDEKQIITIFIHTPREDLHDRLVRRGTDAETIKARLDRAERDYAAASKCDYIVENKDGQMEETLLAMYRIIFRETFASI